MDLQLLSAGDDIRLWDCPDFVLTHQLNPHNQNISSACWAADNTFLASVSVHTEDVILSYTRKQETSAIQCGTGCTCVDINDTSRYMLTGGSDGIISVWDLKTKKIRKTYKGHKGPISCAKFNQATTVIASGSETGEIILYNVITGQGCKPLKTANVQAVKQVQYSHLKKSLLGSVSDDGCVSLWDCNTKQLVHNFPSHHAPATGLSFSPVNNIFLMSVGLDKRITCHDVQTNEIVKVINADSPLTSVDILHDGYTVVVGTTRGKIYHYDLRMTAGQIHTLDAHRSSVQTLKFQVLDKGESSTERSQARQSNKTRQLPQSPKVTREVLAPQVSNIKTNNQSAGGVDVFSPLREGYPNQSGEEADFSPSSNYNNNSSQNYNSYNGNYSISFSHKPTNNSNTFTDGVFSPVNDALGRSSGGASLSPLAFTGYQSIDQYHNSSGLGNGEYRHSAQGTTTPASSRGVDVDHQGSLLPSNIPSQSSRLNSVSMDTQPQHAYSNQDQYQSSLPTPSRKQVAFKTEETDAYGYQSGSSSITSDTSPTMRQQQQQIGVSASPSLPSLPLDDSPGSVAGGAYSIGMDLATPDIVNAQSLVNGSHSESRLSAGGRNCKGSSVVNRTEASGSGNRTVGLSVEAGQLAEIVRGVVQEELGELKKEIRSSVREEVEDMTYELHKDIITLQAEMLLQFQSHQEDMMALLQHYSINEDLVLEVERLKEELKRLKTNF